MGWFMLDQQKLIQNQQEQIQKLKNQITHYEKQ
jgi:hypothetical protein